MAGRVVDFDTGMPIAGAEVSSWSALGQIATMTDTDGRFELAHVPRSGRPRLSFGAPGYVSDGFQLELPGDARSQPEPFALRIVRGSDPQQGPDDPYGFWLEGVGPRLRVRDVRVNLAGAQAGLVRGDVLLAVNGKTLDGLGDAGVKRLIIRDAAAGARLQVRSGDQPPREVVLRVASAPTSR
jgi:hypothetical protein